MFNEGIFLFVCHGSEAVNIVIKIRSSMIVSLMLEGRLCVIEDLHVIS